MVRNVSLFAQGDLPSLDHSYSILDLAYDPYLGFLFFSAVKTTTNNATFDSPQKNHTGYVVGYTSLDMVNYLKFEASRPHFALDLDSKRVYYFDDVGDICYREYSAGQSMYHTLKKKETLNEDYLALAVHKSSLYALLNDKIVLVNGEGSGRNHQGGRFSWRLRVKDSGGKNRVIMHNSTATIDDPMRTNIKVRYFSSFDITFLYIYNCRLMFQQI